MMTIPADVGHRAESCNQIFSGTLGVSQTSMSLITEKPSEAELFYGVLMSQFVISKIVEDYSRRRFHLRKCEKLLAKIFY